jgi:hypothetical protein
MDQTLFKKKKRQRPYQKRYDPTIFAAQDRWATVILDPNTNILKTTEWESIFYSNS